MEEYLPFLVIGLASGSIYAIAAMGLVVTYKTSGVFNFAHGAVGMIATFIFYSLRVDLGVPTWLAAALAILVVAPLIGVVIDRVLLRRLRGAAASSYVVVSLGLLVGLQYLAIVIYGPATRSVEPIFSRATFRLPGVNVGYDQAIIVAISLASALLLAAFFRGTRLGIQTRAVVDDADLTELMGTSSARVTTFSWMLGCSFAALAGVLLSPFLGIDAVLLTLLVIKAFGAAAVGRLVSLPATYLGAIGIGVGEALLTKWVAARPSLAGLPTSLSFIVLFAVLVFSRKGSFAELTTQAVRTAGGARARLISARGRRFPMRLMVVMGGIAVLLPAQLDGSRLLTATSTLAFVLVFASLGLLVGLSRQVSLCHAVFVVFGATTLSHFQEAGIPYLLALLLAGLVLVPVGALVAIPAIRLSGLFLALATFGFGVLAQYLIFGTKFAFGTKALRTLTRPELFGISFVGDRAFYYFVLALVVAGVVAIELVRVTRLGRILRALADSPTATESVGVNPTASRVIVFCLSAFLAAIAGGLLGSLTQVVNPTSFDFSQSLFWIAVLVTAGPATLGGAILSAVLLVTVPAIFTAKAVAEWQPVAFGVLAIALAQAPNGLAGLVRLPDFTALARASAWRRRSTGSRLRERVAARAAVGEAPAPAPAGSMAGAN
ncbi:MAG TPA: ABC transporter permease [Acidimicrobiia bacterium]|nr:ABC transporter permease [Acidimicrobiia bacterium]